MGHYKKDSLKFKAWLDKKIGNGGKFLALTCFGSHLVDVPLNSWCSGASIHLTKSLHGIKNKKKPNKDGVNLCIGNGNKTQIKWIGDVNLQLDIDFVLNLKNVVFVPSMKRNLISLSRLDVMRFFFTFAKKCLHYCMNQKWLVGVLSDRLYIHLDLSNDLFLLLLKRKDK